MSVWEDAHAAIFVRLVTNCGSISYSSGDGDSCRCRAFAIASHNGTAIQVKRTFNYSVDTAPGVQPGVLSILFDTCEHAYHPARLPRHYVRLTAVRCRDITIPMFLITLPNAMYYPQYPFPMQWYHSVTS